MTGLKRYRLDCADGEWTPYDEAARALIQARADAAVAVAEAIRRAAENKEQLDIWAQEILEGLSFADVLKITSYDDKIEAHNMVGRGLVDVILNLAPADALAEVQRLRVEARENAMQALASMGQAQEAYEAQLEAEAELAATQTQVGDWVVRADEANVKVEKLEAELARVKADAAAAVARKTFPILKGDGAKIDYQLVADHAEQAKANHYQTVERLAERGGLSWCELYAVLHNRKWEKIETNEAMIACRALEARYLAALAPDAGTAALAKLRERAEKAEAALAERKMAPVQGFAAGIPWKMHLRAYDAYCKRYRPQQAMIEGGCRGGFSVNELDMLIPGWRDDLSAIRAAEAERDTLAASLAAQTALVATLTAFVQRVADVEWQADEPPSALWCPNEDAKAYVAELEHHCNWTVKDARDILAMATMTPEERAMCERSLAVRDAWKKVAEGQG